MEAFRLRIASGLEVEIVQAARVPAIGETVLDADGEQHVVKAVQWSGEYRPTDGIRVLLAYVVAR